MSTAGADPPSTSSPSGRFEALDGYRALAAIAVLVSHVAGSTGVTGRGSSWSLLLANIGSSAVPIFFVLSGFLLYRPFVSAHFDATAAPSARTYLRHRLLRIFPAFWLAAIGYIVLVGPPFERTVGNFISALTLTVPYRDGLYFGNAILGVDWTLSVELAFYLSLPLIALAIGTAARRASTTVGKLRVEMGALALLYAVSLAYRAEVITYVQRLDVSASLWLFNYVDWFALGMGLSVLWAWRARGGRLPAPLVRLASNWGVCWLLAGWAYLVLSVTRYRISDGAFFVDEPTSFVMVRFALNGSIGFLLVLPAVLGTTSDSRIRRFLCRPVVAWLGTVSFGIYLWHTTWLRWVSERLPGIGFWPALAAVVVLTIPTAAASWYLLERPLMRWRRPTANPVEHRAAAVDS